MRLIHARSGRPGDLRRQLERLTGLPLRPSTVRGILAALPDEPPSTVASAGETIHVGEDARIDPGWVLAESLARGPVDALTAIANCPWWPCLSDAAAEAVRRLWHHAVAVSCAALRLAREADDPDPASLARAGLLHNLGYWSLAAVEPERLAPLLAIGDAALRRSEERSWMGVDAAELGRTLAERWGGDALLVDAAWLHADRGQGLDGCAEDPNRLALIQTAYAWAERTPWAMFPPRVQAPQTTDHRLRWLVAEVQGRCTSSFSDVRSPVEEKLARSHARLRLEMAKLLQERADQARILDALAETSSTEGPDAWAERVEQAWERDPRIGKAQLLWAGPCADSSTRGTEPDAAPDSEAFDRPTDEVVPLTHRGNLIADLRLWASDDARPAPPPSSPVVAAWGAWAGHVAERGRMARRLEAAVETLRRGAEREEPARRAERLGALAEFAAGAGHELNNPLAVILGRAQLLLTRHRDPDSVRSLRAIVCQAQRAHRILRDLMYVARPPALRPRPCQPDEIVRATLRDLQEEAEARGVRLVLEASETSPRAWVDPDPLRHLIETLARNAIEATPAGGSIRVALGGDARHLHWSIQDSGRGLSPDEAEHLFDPFFCGRQAGRGLGLGLPRAARFVAQAGGQIRWRSSPGRGTIFHMHLPLQLPIESTQPEVSADVRKPPTPRPATLR